ncbi:hypothetical protein JCM1393_23330 [Clostridium carnis]
MSINEVTSYLSNYGMIFLFIIVFLEYLNLPGLAAGIIFPLAGAWVANSQGNLFLAIGVSVLAGVIGSWILYGIGWYGGEILIKKYTDKFPKQKEVVDKNIKLIREKGNYGIFISKLIPMIRTIVSLPAGALKLNFLKYTIYSALGILIWNGAFMGAGYFFGEAVLKVLA